MVNDTIIIHKLFLQHKLIKKSCSTFVNQWPFRKISKYRLTQELKTTRKHVIEKHVKLLSHSTQFQNTKLNDKRAKTTASNDV